MAYDRLANVEEFIRDTEEFVNFELDSSRNRLIRLEIVLTSATFGLAIFGTVAGLPQTLQVVLAVHVCPPCVSRTSAPSLACTTP